MHWIHETQEEVWDDRGGVQGEEKTKGASSVGGGVRGEAKVQEYGQKSKGKTKGRVLRLMSNKEVKPPVLAFGTEQV